MQTINRSEQYDEILLDSDMQDRDIDGLVQAHMAELEQLRTQLLKKNEDAME